MAGFRRRNEGTMKALVTSGLVSSSSTSSSTDVSSPPTAPTAPSSGRTGGGRQRTVSVRYKNAVTSGEARREAEAARLAALESDNFTQPELPPDADDEYMEEDLEEEVIFPGRKRKKKTKEAGGSGPKRKVGGAKRNLVTTLNRALELEGEDVVRTNNKNATSQVPTYHSVAAAPSTFPLRFFCSACGFQANYKCPRCGARFCSTLCNNIHKESRCLKWTS